MRAYVCVYVVHARVLLRIYIAPAVGRLSCPSGLIVYASLKGWMMSCFLFLQAADIWAMGITLYCFIYGQVGN